MKSKSNPEWLSLTANFETGVEPHFFEKCGSTPINMDAHVFA